jgi:hypothetical protein
MNEISQTGSRSFTLLTNHGAVLIYVREYPDATVRQISDAIGITERATARILRDLKLAGYISVERAGRRNVYAVRDTKTMVHAPWNTIPITVLVDSLAMNRGRDGAALSPQVATPTIA